MSSQDRLNEIQFCLAAVQEAYPHFLDGRTMQQSVALWDKFFQEPKDAILAAISAFISSDTKGFPPNIGQIKEKLSQMGTQEPDEMQAWAIVRRALSRASRAEFAKLPLLIQQCIDSPETFIEWSYEDIGAVDTVIAAGFMRTYRARAEKQKEYGKLPAFAKGNYPALEQQAYRLPPPREVQELVDDRVEPPESVLERVAEIRKMIPSAAQENPKDRADRLMRELTAELRGK